MELQVRKNKLHAIQQRTHIALRATCRPTSTRQVAQPCKLGQAQLLWQASKPAYHWHMPRQNTSPADFPPAILAQIEQLARSIVAQRKRLGETQAQWAARLGISQPTMARIERGDPAVAMATYVSCLWQLNPALDLTQLLAPATQAATASSAIAVSADAARARSKNGAKPRPDLGIKTSGTAEQQAQIERNFAAAKAALDFFKSPLF